MKRNFKNYHANISFIDLLFNLVLGLTFLFFVSFMLINLNSKKANIETKAEFIITLTWDKGNPDDIDLWVQDPEDRILFFKNKEMGIMHLDRDDLGDINDVVTTLDGRRIVNPYNQEIATIRGNIPGEWIVNVHVYNKRCIKPVNVEVKVEKLNPSVKLVTLERFVMTVKGEEVTVIRFFIDAQGNVISTDKLPKKIVEQKLIYEGYGRERGEMGP